MIEFVNLTNGIFCNDIADPESVRFTRIQSTKCEQKDWESVIGGVGPDFWMALAQDEVVVHDVSEKPRETRAMWQGLYFIELVARLEWGIAGVQFPARGGKSMYQYLYREYRQLPRRVTLGVRFYSKFSKGTIELRSCWTGRKSDSVRLLREGRKAVSSV